MNWMDCPEIEKRLVKEWTLAQTGIVRAYRNKEITPQKYGKLKKKLKELLEQIYQVFLYNEQVHDAIGECYESNSNC